jgi:hypothetical protein
VLGLLHAYRRRILDLLIVSATPRPDRVRHAPA